MARQRDYSATLFVAITLRATSWWGYQLHSGNNFYKWKCTRPSSSEKVELYFRNKNIKQKKSSNHDLLSEEQLEKGIENWHWEETRWHRFGSARLLFLFSKTVKATGADAMQPSLLLPVVLASKKPASKNGGSNGTREMWPISPAHLGMTYEGLNSKCYTMLAVSLMQISLSWSQASERRPGQSRVKRQALCSGER